VICARRGDRRGRVLAVLALGGRACPRGLGPAGSHPQPGDATIRDWRTLTARFNGDPNVVYEIFDEPQSPPTPEGWALWRNAAGRHTVRFLGGDGNVDSTR
jgi:hypothetical protein